MFKYINRTSDNSKVPLSACRIEEKLHAFMIMALFGGE